MSLGRGFLAGIVDFYVALFVSTLVSATVAVMCLSVWATLVHAATEIAQLMVLAAALHLLGARRGPGRALHRCRRYIAGVLAPAFALVGIAMVGPVWAGPKAKLPPVSLLHCLPFLSAATAGAVMGGRQPQLHLGRRIRSLVGRHRPVGPVEQRPLEVTWLVRHRDEG